MTLPLRIELAMTFKAVFLIFWPGTTGASRGRRSGFGLQHTDFAGLCQRFTGGPLMAKNDQPSPWWSPARHADIRPFLVARSAITRAIRAWFDEQGFAEVETGILQVSP